MEGKIPTTTLFSLRQPLDDELSRAGLVKAMGKKTKSRQEIPGVAGGGQIGHDNMIT